jgi:hypothetical protein
VVPIFRVEIFLEKSNRVELRPSVQELFNMINSTAKAVIDVTQCVPRIAQCHTPATLASMQVCAEGCKFGLLENFFLGGGGGGPLTN